MSISMGRGESDYEGMCSENRGEVADMVTAAAVGDRDGRAEERALGRVFGFAFQTGRGWLAVTGTELGVLSVALPAPSEEEARREAEATVAWRVGRSKAVASEPWGSVLWDAGEAFERLCYAESLMRDLVGYVDRGRSGLSDPEVLRRYAWSRLGLTDFQISVYEACASIPFGEVRTYSQLAAEIGRPGAARAVGGALRRNPVPILVPCHRVVGSDGSLRGFGGSRAEGLEVKRWLLELEGATGDQARSKRRR